MKKTYSNTYTVSKFAGLTGIDRHELQRRLEAANAIPASTTARGADEFKLRELATAFAGGDERAERLRKTRAEAERIEIQNQRSHRELVLLSEIEKCIVWTHTKIRSIILTSRLEPRDQDEILQSLFDLRLLLAKEAPDI